MVLKDEKAIMKKVKFLMLICLLFQPVIYANSTEDILKEIKQLRIDMNKRFEQVDKRFEMMQKNMDKRFEIMQKNMDKRFEQVDKRFDTVFNILYILMGLVFASSFIAIYLRDKKDQEERKNFDIIKGMLFTLRELAQTDEKIARSLRAANLL